MQARHLEFKFRRELYQEPLTPSLKRQIASEIINCQESRTQEHLFTIAMGIMKELFDKKKASHAIEICRTLYKLNIFKERAIKTLMRLANQYSNCDLPERQIDIDQAIMIWKEVINLSFSAEQNEITLKTMTVVFNKLCEKGSPLAVKLGRIIYELEKEKTKAIRIIIKAVNRISEEDAALALKLSLNLYPLVNAFEGQKLISNLFNRADKSEAFCKKGIVFLESNPYHSQNNFHFYAMALIAFHYFMGNYNWVINFVDSNLERDPLILIQKAEAKRKLRAYEEAIQIADNIITRYKDQPLLTPQENHSLVNAFCCIGYCHFEEGKALDQSKQILLWDKARQNFTAAIDIATKHQSQVPPRAWEGIGYIEMALSNYLKALPAFKESLKIDPGNKKTEEAIIKLSYRY